MADHLGDNSNDEGRRSSISSGGADSPSPVRNNPVSSVSNGIVVAPYSMRQPQQVVVARASSFGSNHRTPVASRAPSALNIGNMNSVGCNSSADFGSGGDSSARLMSFSGPPSRYVKLNVGGCLHYTTIATLTKHDSMLRAMFSGRMEVLADLEGWVLIDRCGKHFQLILNFLRDNAVALPESRREILEILAEAKYYCIQSLIELCQSWLELTQKSEETLPVCKIPIITSVKEEKSLLQSTKRPAIKLLINRHNNKYSYTSQSDDNLLKNLELFDKLIMRFHERVLFIKDVGAANEVCSWSFYGHGRKVFEVCCTSIVYATDKKHTKVEFPEARIYEEAMNVLLYEPDSLCPSCMSLNWVANGGGAAARARCQDPHCRSGSAAAGGGADSADDSTAAGQQATTGATSGYCSDRERRSERQRRASRAAEV